MSTASDCPPNRDNYKDENGKFDARKYFNALHECNKKKIKTINIEENTNPEYCDNRGTMKEKDGDDTLLKFKKGESIHCMYFSEFKIHIQNICNIYTQWTCINKNLCDKIDENTGKPDTSGKGYAPILQAYDLLGILKFTNHCCIINHLYWQVPLFSKGLLSMKTILKIQNLVNKSTNDEIEIVINNVNKTKDEFRLGNIYGTFGIGQTHAQADPTIFYILEDESELEPTNLTDCDIKPDNNIFNFDKMDEKLTLQLEIKDLINRLYNHPLDLYSDEGLKKFFLNNKDGFQEQQLCPDTETVVQLFFMYYNNDILVPAADNAETIPKITENMTLIEMRNIINENQVIIEDQNKAKNEASFAYSDDVNDGILNNSITSTPNQSRSVDRALFSGSPMSPINGSVLDTSIRSEYDIALGNESTYMDRTPVSPMMRRLNMSDLATTPESAVIAENPNSEEDHFGRLAFTPTNLSGEFEELERNNSRPGGGRKTFNRKKKPNKNKTKKKRRTKKCSKK